MSASKFTPDERKTHAERAGRTSATQVAQELGISSGTVRRWMHSFGVNRATRVSSEGSTSIAPTVYLGEMARGINGELDPDVGVMMPMRGLDTGEWEARNGANCGDCGGFGCVGVYGGICTYMAEEMGTPCPCDCGAILDESGSWSIADMYGYTGSDPDNPDCAAASLPDINGYLMAGRTALGDNTVLISDYSYKLVAGEYRSDDPSYDDGFYGVELYYRDELVSASRDDEGDTSWMKGEAMARAHGYMMYHAADVSAATAAA